MRTLCEKCIFSDHSDSDEPCKMNIIQEIKNNHNITISENNFNIITDYVCRYGFDLNTYDQNKKDLGSIDDLKTQIYNKAKIKYYLLIDVTNVDNIANVCQEINNLYIKPGYVSFLLNKENHTEIIISNIKKELSDTVPWKIHNFLEENTDLNKKLNTVVDTNAKKNDTVYFWVDNDFNSSLWNQEIKNINKIIYIHQPKCHALFRSTNKDGLFLSFDLYKLMRTDLDPNIFKALEVLENPQFIYYA